MATIKYRKRRSRGPPPGERVEIWNYLCDEAGTREFLFVKFGDLPEDALAVAWQRYRDDIIAEFARTKPGRRPSRWWSEEGHMRERLGGAGELRDGGKWHLGLPQHWEPRSIRWDDLPVYESEAACLKRLGLLLPGEAARLCPEDLIPERIQPGIFRPHMFCPHCHEYLHVEGVHMHSSCPHCGASYANARKRIDEER